MYPKTPQAAAGILIEPPISEPEAMAQAPVARATPEPPDDPPGVYFLFHGLVVIPCRSDQVVPNKQNSGVVVLNNGILP